MKYTFLPLDVLDTIHSHDIFYFVIFIAVFCLLFCYNYAEYWVAAVIVVSVAGVISWNTGSITVYKNEPVIATLVNFQPEVWTETVSSGKSNTHTETIRKMYVVYSVDNNNVIFDADKGNNYPKTVTLYKN